SCPAPRAERLCGHVTHSGSDLCCVAATPTTVGGRKPLHRVTRNGSRHPSVEGMNPTEVRSTPLPTPAPDPATRTEVLERRRARRGTKQQEFTSDFSALMAQVKEAGLLARRPGWNLLRFCLLGLGYAAALTMLFLIGVSWWQLATAVVFGALFTQTAYVAHDAAHRQIFSSRKAG